MSQRRDMVIEAKAARARRRREGVTLVEMMIVILIMAVAAGAVSYSLNAVDRANLRSGSLTVAAAARYAYGRAIQQNTTVRLAFNLEGDCDGEPCSTMSLEEGHGRVTLARVDDPRRQALEDGDVAAVDPWAAAAARMGDTLRPSFGSSPFSTVAHTRFCDGGDTENCRPRVIAPGVRVDRIYVPHEPEPVTEGEGAIYFFPGGQTEHAVLWLTDDSDHVYSIELHPLTGRATVRNEAYEPQTFLDDGQGNARSEVDAR